MKKLMYLKKGSVLYALFTTVFSASLPLSASDGVPVFSEDFTTAALMAERWEFSDSRDWVIADGSLSVVGGRVASAVPLAAEVDGPMSVAFRIKVRDFGDTHRWVGARVRGIHFTLRPGSFWHVYRIGGHAHSLGGSQQAHVEINRWYHFRIEQQGDRFRWFVDGQLVVDLHEPGTITGAGRDFELVTAGPLAAYDDVVVAPLVTEGALSRNYLRNAAFEEVPDVVPTYWKPDGIGFIPPERLWARWGVTRETSWYGEQSLRVAAGGFASHQNGMPVGSPCTFSVYLKADRPELKAQLFFWEYFSGRRARKTVSVGTEWKRYVFTDVPERTEVRVGVRLMEEGTLWADAAQLELGETATDFTLADRDREAAQVPEAAAVQPAMNLAVGAEAPKLDGRLEEAIWNEDTRIWPLLLPGGEKPKEATEAYLVVVDDILYVGIRCHDSDMANLRAEVTERGGPVQTDDVVDLRIDTTLDRMDYYHFVLNALGVQAESGPGRDADWGLGWEAETYRGATYWSAEIALPLAVFRPSPLMSSIWGVNLGRSNHKAGEYASTALPRFAGFDCADIFPELHLPEGAFTHLRVAPEALALKPGLDGKIRLTGHVINRSGRDRQVVVRGVDADWRSERMALAAGERVEFVVEGLQIPREQSQWRVRGVVQADDGGGERDSMLHAFSDVLSVRRELEGLLERNFYTHESHARFWTRVSLPRERLEESRLTWRLGDQSQTIGGEALVTLRDHFPIDIPLAEVATGTHSLSVTLYDGEGAERSRLETKLRKLPPTDSFVSIDHRRRCVVVDDQPFFVFAPLYHFFPHTSHEAIESTIIHYADAGFRSIMVVARHDTSEASWERVFETCRDRGLKVIAWPGGDRREPETFKAFIERWRGHPALLAWLPVDEPEISNAPPQATIDTIGYFQELDPYHPVYVNYTRLGIPGRYAGLPGDLLSLDDYVTNAEGRQVREVLRHVERMVAVAAETDRPSWMFLVGNNIQNHYREPTPGEQVAQSYGSVLTGASGLTYFYGQPVDREHWVAYRQLNHEMLSLAPVLLSAEPAPQASCSSPAIRFATRRVGADVYLIAVNLENRPVNARFTLPGANDSTAVVVFENKMARFEGGMLAVAFEPHQRVVYRLNIPASCY